MKQLGISIIGTDTDVGKTFVTGLLGAMAVDDGFAVGMVKPVSSSAVPFPECVTMDEDNYNVDLESKDATHLMRAAGIPESRRHEVNPYAIAGDFSPRLAAELSGMTQSSGYILAAIGPMLIGYLFDLTHLWTIPLIALTVVSTIMTVFGMLSGRNRYV